MKKIMLTVFSVFIFLLSGCNATPQAAITPTIVPLAAVTEVTTATPASPTAIPTLVATPTPVATTAPVTAMVTTTTTTTATATVAAAAPAAKPTVATPKTATAKKEEATPAYTSLTGDWDFTFGTMTLNQRNSDVTGTYQWYGGIDSGQINGVVVTNLNQFQGMWLSNRSPNSQSFLRWQILPGWASFTGNFEGGKTGQWCGVRTGQPLPAGCGFSGAWQLQFGNPAGVTGQATLVQTGSAVQGTYVDSQGHSGKITGVVAVDSITQARLTGTWSNDRGEQDSFEWQLDLTTGRTFQGRRNPGNSEWCGWRPDAGKPQVCSWQD